MRLSKPAALGGLCLVLVACSEREAGSAAIENPSFGVAATQNRIAQLSLLSLQGQAVSLGALFEDEVEDTVYFDFNSTELDFSAQVILDAQAQWLRGRPEARYEIEGHADLVGGEEFNAELALRRAQTVLDYLAGVGIARNRLNAVTSFSEDQPAVDTEEHEPLNRRVTTRVFGTEVFVDGSGFDGVVANEIYTTYRTAPKQTLTAGSNLGE